MTGKRPAGVRWRPRPALILIITGLAVVAGWVGRRVNGHPTRPNPDLDLQAADAAATETTRKRRSG